MSTPTDPARDPDDERPLDPSTEARVRALLAGARHDQPTPEAVVQRLDRVLAELASDDEAAAAMTTGPAAPDADIDPVPHAEVVDLAAQRRRRRVASLLVAAAAVVVVGLGVGQVIGVRGAEDASTAAREADLDSGGDAASDPSAASSAEEGASESSRLAAVPGPTMLPVQEPQRVRPDQFTGDVRRVLRFTQQELAAAAADGTAPLSEGANGSGGVPEGTDAGGGGVAEFATGFDCKPAAWGAGLIVPVTYGEEPAVLAFRPPTGDTRVAELLRCGSGDLLRSVTLSVG